MTWIGFALSPVYFPLLSTVTTFFFFFLQFICYVMWLGFFFCIVLIQLFQSQENGACAHYFMASKYSMEAILSCHPALSTEWPDWVAISCELWRICTGPVLFWCWLKGYSTCKNNFMPSSIDWLWIEKTLPRFFSFQGVYNHLNMFVVVAAKCTLFLFFFLCISVSKGPNLSRCIWTSDFHLFLLAVFFLFFCLSVIKAKSRSSLKL